MLIVLLMSLAIGCGKNNEVLNSDEIAELRSEYPLCKGINIPAISTSIGSVGIDEYFKLQNRNYDYMYAVVEFVKDKGTESYNIVMGEDTPEYKVNKQLGTPVSNAIEIYQLSVKISELICGDVTELPERIFDNSQYVTLIFNEINKEMLPEFKEGEEYVMMLGILREDSDIREKYVNNPEIFPGEIYYMFSVK